MSDRVPIGLCLGMYLNPTRDCKTPKQKRFGSEYRDKVRCKKLEELLGIKVVTLNKDNHKHDLHHICSNFNKSSNTEEDINDSFPDGSFITILYMFLDHFHTPVNLSTFYLLLYNIYIIYIFLIIIYIILGFLGI